MVKKNSEKCKSTGTIRKDRQAESKLRFDPLNIEVRNPDTSILLLNCQEQAVLLAAAESLSKFGSKDTDNLKALFDLDILESIISLTNHENIITRRFATKLLAEMSAIPNVRNYLLDSQRYIPYFVEVLSNDMDNFMHEFATLILVELSRDMFGVAKFVEQCDQYDILFDRIRSSNDPDVKKNSLQIIYNLLQDPVAAQKIIKSKNFSFTMLYELLGEPYPIIQKLSLEIINMLVARNKDDNIQDLFHESRGLQWLLDVLEVGGKIDTRKLMLGVPLKKIQLRTRENKFASTSCRISSGTSYDDLNYHLEIDLQACDSLKTVSSLGGSNGIHRLFKYRESSSGKQFEAEILNVIVRLANSREARKTLYDLGIVEYLLNLLHKSSDPGIRGACCYGIAKMVRHTDAADKINSINPIKDVLDIIKNEHLPWSLRQKAMFCVSELLTCGLKNCLSVLEMKGQSQFIWIIAQPFGTIPNETQITALHCLAMLGVYPEIREQLIDSELISVICDTFKLRQLRNNSFAEIKVAYCNTLSTLCIERTARQIFLKINGPTWLFNLLQDVESVPVKEAAARLILQLSTDAALAPEFVQAGCLEYMLKHRSISRIVPSWDSCIKQLFDTNLPAKFAFTGRLSMHDVTKDGFYVMRRNIHPFPSLKQLLILKDCSMPPVYVCNFAEPDQTRRTTSIEQENIESRDPSENSRSSAFEDKNTDYFDDTTETVTKCTEQDTEKLPDDPFLYEYLDLFKSILRDLEAKSVHDDGNPRTVNISCIKSRAKLLGDFVARRLSGLDRTAKDHHLELHVNEIKYDIKTNVIPLGRLRVGLYLERAILFKAIADRICLPVALVRGEYGKAWIEISVPEIEHANVIKPLAGLEESNDKKHPGPLFDKNNATSSKSVEDDISEPIEASTDISSYRFPTKLLRPNYIVDLMHVPGQLIPLDCKQAVEYRSYQLLL